MKIVLCDIDGTISWDHKRKHFCANKTGAKISMKTVRENYSIGKFLTEKQRKIYYNLTFSNKYTHMDIPRKGAKETLKKLSKKYIIVYFTARTEKRMKKGTLEWLKKHNFPYPDNKKVFLFMKSRFNTETKDDVKYKEEAIRKTKELGEPFASIDDLSYTKKIYEGAGFKSIIIETPQNSTKPGKKVKNWSEIRKKLFI
ncbi:MAG: hypothetical protein ISS36_01005 [Candidatus Aenigmarchaeota archaeon]|nr:hypothetical protein [Candidatus Aenigmarchaeota archaeon]